MALQGGRPFKKNQAKEGTLISRIFLIILKVIGISVPLDLAIWGHSGLDRTTKIFPEKVRDKKVQETMAEFEYAQCSFFICFWVFVIEFL